MTASPPAAEAAPRKRTLLTSAGSAAPPKPHHHNHKEVSHDHQGLRAVPVLGQLLGADHRLPRHRLPGGRHLGAPGLRGGPQGRLDRPRRRPPVGIVGDLPPPYRPHAVVRMLGSSFEGASPLTVPVSAHCVRPSSRTTVTARTADCPWPTVYAAMPNRPSGRGSPMSFHPTQDRSST